MTADHYYRLALSAAAQRNLRGAIEYAYYAVQLGGGHEKAARLLCLCHYQLGETSAVKDLLPDFPDIDAAVKEDQDSVIVAAEQIRSLVRRKKWRDAARLAASVKHQSVRLLNIQGCLYASAKQYREAARVFAEASRLDKGNPLAMAGLAEVATRKTRFGGFFKK